MILSWQIEEQEGEREGGREGRERGKREGGRDVCGCVTDPVSLLVE